MPRRASVPDSEETVPSAPRAARPRRKRVVSEATTEEASSASVDERVGEDLETSAPRPRRKAPTRRVAEPVAAESTPAASAPAPRRPKRSRLSTIVMVLLFLGAIGVSAALGFADKGGIDVAAKLQEQGQIQANIAGEQSGSESQVIPVQSTPVTVPNGGLMGAGFDAAPPPPPAVETSTSTATTTDSGETATSTEASPVETETAPVDSAIDASDAAVSAPVAE